MVLKAVFNTDIYFVYLYFNYKKKTLKGDCMVKQDWHMQSAKNIGQTGKIWRKI